MSLLGPVTPVYKPSRSIILATSVILCTVHISKRFHTCVVIVCAVTKSLLHNKHLLAEIVPLDDEGRLYMVATLRRAGNGNGSGLRYGRTSGTRYYPNFGLDIVSGYKALRIKFSLVIYTIQVGVVVIDAATLPLGK
jgi:hypothetical protein